MSELPPEESPLTISAHPVTRVYCDEQALVCYERDGAAPIQLNTVSPQRSRQEAVRRCRAMVDGVSKGTPLAQVDLSSFEFLMPISTTGVGLNYRQLMEQTYLAVQRSKELEVKLIEQFNAKRKKYGV